MASFFTPRDPWGTERNAGVTRPRCECCGEFNDGADDGYGHACECHPRRLRLAQLGARVLEILHRRDEGGGDWDEVGPSVDTAARSLGLLDETKPTP